MSKNLPILIVGGGIGGLSLALALAQKNIRSQVLEQAPSIRETGAGIQLCPNVFKMFDRLGFVDEIVKIAFFPENLIYTDGFTGQNIYKVPFGDPFLKRFKYPYGVFHREELLHFLNDECKKSHLISLVTSARIIDFEEVNDKVLARAENGTIYEGEALVGADGLWSVVRERLIGDGKPKPSGLVSYRGVAPISKIPKRFLSPNVYHWVKPAHLVYYQIHHGELFNIVAVFHAEGRKPEDTFGSQEELHEQFKDTPPEMLELLTMVNKSQSWVLSDRDPIDNWSKGRITLMGDAAHPTLPHLTQGAGMAIEDALVLAHKIVMFNKNYASAFIAYQKERYLRTARVQLFSRLYKEIFHATGVARELRNQLLATRTTEDNYDWIAWAYNGIDIK